jgi:phage-related protein
MKPVFWAGHSRQDLRECPEDVQRLVGYALYFAQEGDKHPRSKPLRGYRGADVLEIVDDYDGDTYRAVYTVRFAEAVYVLHVFQKKSSHGIATSRRDLDLIESRLRWAEEHHLEWLKRERSK